MKFLSSAALLLTLLARPLTAQAPASTPRTERAGQALNLSATQKASLKSIRESHHAELLLKRDAVQQARAALQTAVQDPATPEAQLRALHGKAASAQFDLLLARRSVQQEVRAVLSPEQLAKAAELRGLARARREERLRHLRLAAGIPG